MTKICPVCNNEFKTNISSKIYCSEECKNNNFYNFEYNKVCKVCKNSFVTKNISNKYCSENCKEIAINTVYNKICVGCGISFNTKRSNQIYCSIECRKLNAKSYYTKLCNNCGNEFKTSNKNVNYCSNECRNSRICVWCGNEFISEKPKTYCGDICKEKALINRNEIKKQDKSKIYPNLLSLSLNNNAINNINDSKNNRLIFNDRVLNTWYLSGFNESLK